MTTTTTAPPEVTPEVTPEDAPPCWPPIGHLVRKEDLPAKAGDRALCGAVLMGVDLGSLLNPQAKVCPKCIEVAERELTERYQRNEEAEL